MGVASQLGEKVAGLDWAAIDDQALHWAKVGILDTIGVTLAGATVWAVTLPFTYFARDSSTFDVLVRGPAEATFTRCLGCGLRGRTRSLPLPSPR